LSLPPTADRSLIRRLLASVLAAVVLVFVGAGFLFADAVQRHISRETETRLRSVAADLLSGLTFEPGGMAILNRLPDDALFEERLSGWYWQIKAGADTIARSRSLLLEDLPSPAPSGSAVTGPQGTLLRVVRMARELGSPARPVTVLVSAPQRAIDDLVAAEVRLLALGLTILLVILLAVTAWLLWRGLSPLRRMEDDLAAMLAGGSQPLRGTGFRELDGVVTLINRLVGESRRLIETNRDVANKLAHALKTPLALIAARTDTSGARPDADIQASVALMRRHIEHNLRRARLAGAPRGVATPVAVEPIVIDLMFAFAHTYRERNLAQSVDIEAGAAFLGERDDLIELVGNLLDNAHRFAGSRVAVSARCRQNRLSITIADDGPGMPQTGFGGVNGAAPKEQGLGLVIAREIVDIYAGTISFAPASGSGLAVIIELPCP
jgi:signal transduction histidine kinase